MSRASDIEQLEVTATDLAKLIGVSRPRISQLANSGVIPRKKSRFYSLCDSLLAYCENLRASRSSGFVRDELLRAQCDKTRVQTAILEGSLLDAETVGEELKQLFGRIDQVLDEIPYRITNDAEFQEKSRHEIDRARRLLVHETEAAAADLESGKSLRSATRRGR